MNRKPLMSLTTMSPLPLGCGATWEGLGETTSFAPAAAKRSSMPKL